MPTTFKGIDFFSSGPHRLFVGAQGETLVPWLSQGVLLPSVLPIGLLDVIVTVRGRLVAASESALWTLRNAMTAQLAHPPVPGTLVDERANSWSEMSFVIYAESDRTDRGRLVSIGYTAIFRRITVPEPEPEK